LSAWMSDKVSRIKLNRETHSLGTFEAMEFLALGILGKLALWDALKTLPPSDSCLQGIDLDYLASRARMQHARWRKDVLPRQESSSPTSLKDAPEMYEAWRGKERNITRIVIDRWTSEDSRPAAGVARME